MRHWSRLATRNWRARKVRTFGAVFAVTLGTAAVVWVMCCHESVRRSAMEWAGAYVGKAHISITSRFGKHDQIPQRLVRQLTAINNVAIVNPRLLLRRSCEPMTLEKLADHSGSLMWHSDIPDVDLQGINLATELRMRTYPITRGRMLTNEDEFSCLIEEEFAHRHGVDLDDYLLVWDQSDDQPYELKIVGLFERHVVGKIQKPLALVRLEVLQRLTLKFALVSTIDLGLRDASPKALRLTETAIQKKARRTAPDAQIRSAAARLGQIEIAQNNQRLVLVMLGCVSMLTALFIILSTLSMGMVERVRQLGLLRCIGVTRFQLMQLVLLEVVPLGLSGVLLGVPLGLGLTALSVWLVPDYIGSFVISWQGIALAAGAGMLTTLLAALLPVIAMLRVSPMEAAHPCASRPNRLLLLAVVGLAALLLVWQHYGIISRTVRDVNFLTMAATAVVFLYFGYALLAPLAVRLIGAPAVVLAALILRVRTRLLQDQVGHAVWRSAGICCGLMVGLSLVVGIIVVNESVTSGWQFPKQFPAAFAWSFGQLSPKTAERIAAVPGVGTFTVANSINVIVEERKPLAAKMLLSVTWFMGVDPDSFFDLVRLEFLEGEGNEQTARELLKEGGYVVIADDFSRSRNKHFGDDVKVYDEQAKRWRHFKVAGVVRSPALDIAAGYFQLESDYSVAASGSVMGSNEDLKRLFKINGANLALLNFDLADEPVPPDWPPPRTAYEAAALPDKCYDAAVPLQRRYRRWREFQVMRHVRGELGDPSLRIGTVADLKDEIDRQLTGITGLLTAIPGVALLVAAVGVANLMTANVTARAKQLAILRAVGATRGLILRIVIGEAIVLGLLGSALGLGLGLHLASNITHLVDRMWGFRVALELPWNYVITSVVLTVGLCILAGIIPARHASRANIVDALHVV